MTWACTCTNSNPDDEPTCRGCGLVRIGPGTKDKYSLLREYLPQLSRIMRIRDYEHYFIDACAGSAVVYDPERKVFLDGSPLIMAKTRERVEEIIKDKTKKTEAKCKFIEYEAKTFEQLKQAVSKYDFVQCIHGDCNEKLDPVLDEISSSTERIKNHFAFVYIDPFGLGTPAIKQTTLKRILERDFTELLIHFSWEGVSRMAGFYKDYDSPDEAIKHKARAYSDSLTAYFGDGWQAIEKKYLHPQARRNAYVNLYESRLKEYYSGSVRMEIPFGSSDPDYYLFFATRNSRAKEIVTNILKGLRRRGYEAIDDFAQEEAVVKPVPKPVETVETLDDFFNTDGVAG